MSSDLHSEVAESCQKAAKNGLKVGIIIQIRWLYLAKGQIHINRLRLGMTWISKKLSRTQLAERRAEGVRMLEAGEMSQVQIARALGVSEAAVSKWNKELQEK
jgi:DNA invertase Pin-like site-specific DNA recombinase